MNALFADSFYFFALLNPNDLAHARAKRLSQTLTAPYVTTAWVLTEVADAMASPKNRPGFLRLRANLLADPHATIIPATQLLFEQSLELYAQRPDKDWSLTDCVSFVVMAERGLTDALTGDHHFEQAGYCALLK